MSPELIVIVPTRSRPMHVQRIVQAWNDTDAFEHGAELRFVIDEDDPAYGDYREAYASHCAGNGQISLDVISRWMPLVPKLNTAAVEAVELAPLAVGFAGDDHLPRTPGWVRIYLGALRAGAGIVHGDDGYQHGNLPTEWAMRADIIEALGRMIPAPVEHLYCDNSVKDLGLATGSLRYLPEVSIEHLHPVAGKADSDEQYERVNSRRQFRGDRQAYREWVSSGLAADAAVVNHLRKGETHR